MMSYGNRDNSLQGLGINNQIIIDALLVKLKPIYGFFNFFFWSTFFYRPES